MPKLSLQSEKKLKKLKLKAFTLYKLGYSYRAVGEQFKPPKSHQWVKNAVDEIQAVHN